MQHTERTISTPSASIQPPPRDMKRLLSALWVFAMFNYLYADVMGLMDSTLLTQYLRGQVDSLRITGEFLFCAAVLMEIPIAMTLLSRVLPDRANRWANIVAGIIKTAAVAGTLLIGSTTGYYLFFATIEIACTMLIVVLAWRWEPVRCVMSRINPAYDGSSHAWPPVATLLCQRGVGTPGEPL